MTGTGTCAAVIVAAGRGNRMGAPDKVLLPLLGRPALAWSLDAAAGSDAIDEVVVVAGDHTRAAIEELVASGRWPKVTAVVMGGERRQDSVEAGLGAVSPETMLVAIHDAARPLASSALFGAVVAAARDHGAAISAQPVVDTLKAVRNGKIERTIPRDGVWAAETPQAFDLGRLREAFRVAAERGLTVTDEAALFEELGWPVAVVDGGLANLKLTRPQDVALAEAILREREGVG